MAFLRIFLLFPATLITHNTFAQPDSTKKVNDQLDSLYILEIEGVKGSSKVLHAEPLYIDLIRDLGARKGEKEWNVGFGLTDNTKYSEYEALVEYEWAPINRLGLEVELPFTFYYRNSENQITDSIPDNRLESLKLAGQYSFFVSEKHKTSMAIGYIHEFSLAPFNQLSKSSIFSGNAFNPFFVVAKRFGDNFHTLIYTGPMIEQQFAQTGMHFHWEMNTNFHYMIDGTRNFIGIEFNKEFSANDFGMVVRPQMRVGLADNLMVGIVAGIPVSIPNQRLSTFVRLIYEPGSKHRH